MTTTPALRLDDLLRPAWRVPRVHALATTRRGGVSAGPYGGWRDGEQTADGLNLGRQAGDDPAHVEANRTRLAATVGVPLAWLSQVHGNDVVDAADVLARARRGEAPVRADASVTDQAGVACIVMVADCMPVLICDARGRAVGAAHAGWRGLAAGVIENTARRVAALAGGDPTQLLAWLGPAIGPRAFEVGPDVRDAFLQVAGGLEEATVRAFVPHPVNAGKYLADLPALARIRLRALGVTQVEGGEACTFTEQARFYSFRRDRVTGRMAAAIWLDGEPAAS